MRYRDTYTDDSRAALLGHWRITIQEEGTVKLGAGASNETVQDADTNPAATGVNAHALSPELDVVTDMLMNSEVGGGEQGVHKVTTEIIPGMTRLKLNER
ncbi:hypothetical protein NDU88_003894 [Pleurodeles waltl]|uniref:Uncharacterized protein n=1 Tax=Pleurodeles waltl TaxID=8319 RepID=A0AAV7REF6_PLEWA|nr:hypothetical protein NDU88_003894 [Pleurodeles waltl]